MPVMKRDFYAFATGIMEAHGVSCPPEEFHREVNAAFHDMEAPMYDRLHQPLWDSLPRQMKALAEDVLERAGRAADPLRLLDIGCGTGMATELLLDTQLGPMIGSIDGLDTSAGMLERYAERSKRWPIQPQLHTGELKDLPASSQYDLIVASSVLHHIPDLPGFLAEVQQRQLPNGFWLHLQDPNGDYLYDTELLAREKQLEMACHKERNSGNKSVLARIGRHLKRQFGSVDPEEEYLERTNRYLLDRGIVDSPLSALEIWTITDIHIYNNEGVSLEKMTQALDGYELVRARSYAFFGKLWSELSKDFQRQEEDLTVKLARNGRNVCASWRRVGRGLGRWGTGGA